MQKKHPIDQLFKQGLSDPDIPFDQRDWEMLEKKLVPAKKMRTAALLWAGSAVAASLVIAAIWLFDSGAHLQDSSMVNRRQDVGQWRPDKPEVQTRGEQQANDASLSHASPVALPAAKKVQAPQKADTIVNRPAIANLPMPQVMGRSQHAIPIPSRLILPESLTIDTSATEPPLSLSWHQKKQAGLTLTVAAAPDLSGTSLLTGKLSSNIGILAAYQLNDRFRISTGVWYAKKIYQADFGAYRPSNGWPSYGNRPELVDADCRVLDIPINVDYILKRSSNAAWFVSGGLSSYIMLSEAYKFTYPGDEHHYPQKYKVRNENRHFLGVANIGVGYQRRLSPAFGITVQPFVKVPLSQIGQGNIKLYSTGVAISADIDLTTRAKR
ncbi:hypothetical protein ACFOET_14870 [Parapedobacter deserti]|uniref:Outer membrane protein beta-barrel domain-containing protein n=1 Tax=Parapedobacter deserti TaxID=1912957 RepID=A0ABV7JLD7_9SPHI